MFIAFDLLLWGERVVSAYRQSQGDIELRRVNTGEGAGGNATPERLGCRGSMCLGI